MHTRPAHLIAPVQAPLISPEELSALLSEPDLADPPLCHGSFLVPIRPNADATSANGPLDGLLRQV